MRWDVDPILIDFGPVAIRWYGLLFAAGVLTAASVFPRLFKRRGYPVEDASAVTLWLLVGLVLGAHLGHLAFYEPRSFFENPRRIIEVGYGLASHGGVAGAIFAMWLYCRRKKVPFYRYCDCLGLATVWIIPFIRTGNFFNSEIIGRPTDVPWGVIFVRRGFVDPRHPAQLYEALAGILLILYSYRLDRRRDTLPPGYATWAILLGYFCARFLIEFVKEHQVLSSGHILTMGHWLSIPVIALSAWGLRRVTRNQPGAPRN